MCGIIGIVGKNNIVPDLVEGLKRLEYRGYDSAGVATLVDGEIHRCRSLGKIVELEGKLRASGLSGHIGIGHTRWATHGAPNTENAHPHATDKVVVVHNGIIENFAELKKELTAAGHHFSSDTDTEVIPHIITRYLEQGDTPQEAVKNAIAKLKGAYALGILFSGYDDLLIAARQGSPLAIGYGDGEMLIGSDAVALGPFTSHISYLEEGDIAHVTAEDATIYDAKGNEVVRKVVQASSANITIGKENYRHFMQKEIFEQPGVIGSTLRAYYNPALGKVELPAFPFELENIERLSVVACGTSFYAGMVAKYWCEEIARIPMDIDIASEFRYRNVVFSNDTVGLFISQSGETADTLAAMRHSKKNGQPAIAVVNVTQSTMAREASIVLPIYSGPEIGVASTKAFTTQLVTLACLILAIARAKGRISNEEETRYVHALSEIPGKIAEILAQDEHIQHIAQELAEARDIVYIGRGVHYPIALEGALKLKEISYIHAEAAAAGELKHGSIALVDEHVPVVAIAPSGALFEKSASNIREVAARGGKIILLSDNKGLEALKDVVHRSIILPEAEELTQPMLYSVPVQLLAYHVAVTKGTDVDQPRNLAKSVTVE